MLTFRIPFNEHIFREQTNLKYKLAFSKTYKSIRKLGIFGLVFLAIGLIAAIDDHKYLNPFPAAARIFRVAFNYKRASYD